MSLAFCAGQLDATQIFELLTLPGFKSVAHVGDAGSVRLRPPSTFTVDAVDFYRRWRFSPPAR